MAESELPTPKASETKTCCTCQESIPLGALMCGKCRQWQTWKTWNFQRISDNVTNIGVILSLALSLIALFRTNTKNSDVVVTVKEIKLSEPNLRAPNDPPNSVNIDVELHVKNNGEAAGFIETFCEEGRCFSMLDKTTREYSTGFVVEPNRLRVLYASIGIVDLEPLKKLHKNQIFEICQRAFPESKSPQPTNEKLLLNLKKMPLNVKTTNHSNKTEKKYLVIKPEELLNVIQLGKVEKPPAVPMPDGSPTPLSDEPPPPATEAPELSQRPLAHFAEKPPPFPPDIPPLTQSIIDRSKRFEVSPHLIAESNSEFNLTGNDKSIVEGKVHIKNVGRGTAFGVTALTLVDSFHIDDEPFGGFAANRSQATVVRQTIPAGESIPFANIPYPFVAESKDVQVVRGRFGMYYRDEDDYEIFDTQEYCFQFKLHEPDAHLQIKLLTPDRRNSPKKAEMRDVRTIESIFGEMHRIFVLSLPENQP